VCFEQGGNFFQGSEIIALNFCFQRGVFRRSGLDDLDLYYSVIVAEVAGFVANKGDHSL